MPQNHVVEFPSAGHYFFMKKPDETGLVIDAFLNSLKPATPTGSQQRS